MKFAEPTASGPEEAAVGGSELCEQLGGDAHGNVAHFCSSMFFVAVAATVAFFSR
jgi:hypothetical protein